MSLIYDTNILIKIVRDKSKNEVVRKLVNPNSLLEITTYINKAEILSIAVQNKWGTARMEKLSFLLEEIVVMDISGEELLSYYVNVDTYSQCKNPNIQSNFSARNMGKNDIWIASVAVALKSTLITTDKDFDHLNNVLLNVIWFDPDSL
jgi:tRNA(fMet)-specific endonuclease VapC